MSDQSAASFRVVLVDHEEFWQRRRAFAGYNYAERCKAAIEAGDGPYFSINEHGFSWECPGCGHSMGGNIGPEPIGGWENPVWAISGTTEAPTLTPSLGCTRWRSGTCVGHWWLREGLLVLA